MGHDGEGRGASRLSMHRLHRSGTRPASVLLVGEAGQLLSEVEGSTLAARAADRMWLGSRRGVDLDVLTDLVPVLRAVHGVFDRWRLWRYDAVLVAVDVTDPRQRARTLERIRDLTGEVLRDAGGATRVVVLGPGAALRQRHGATGDERLRTAVEGAGSDRVRFRGVPVGGAPLERDRAWASALGEEVVAALRDIDALAAAARPGALRDRPDDETARQRALDALGVVGRAPDPHLTELVELARTAFGTDAAEINFIDHDHQVKAAVAGGDPGRNPRAHSFCSQTIRRSGPTVVADARLDPRFRSSPLAAGPNAIRFYAAHPIESQDGYRIGSFCVYDRQPRDVSGLDLAVLRDLALLAQAELTRVDEAPVGAGASS